MNIYIYQYQDIQCHVDHHLKLSSITSRGFATTEWDMRPNDWAQLRQLSSRRNIIIMCDSGLVVVAVLTLMFTFIAIQSIFYSFDFNCNNFYFDDVVILVF